MTVVIEMTMKLLMISSGTIFLMLVWQPHMNVIDGKGDHVRLVFMSEGRKYQSTFHLTVTTLDREDSRLESVCAIEDVVMTSDSTAISRDAKQNKNFTIRLRQVKGV